MRALGLMVAVAAGTLTYPIDRPAIEAALTIANSSTESDHRRFHAAYHFPVNAPPVDFIAVVTPFRRVVLRAETEARHGGRRLGQREALAALQPDPDRVEIYAELTFHPHHAFLGMPEYTLFVEPPPGRGQGLMLAGTERVPRFGPRLETPWYPFSYPFRPAPRVPGRTDSMTGGTLVGVVTAGELGADGLATIAVMDRGKPLAVARVDLVRLR